MKIPMKWLVALLFVAIAAALPYPAEAFLRGGSSSVSCPQGTSFSDGCPGAPIGPANAPGLFTSGTGGTGTSYVAGGGVRPPWNVANVDYRVGVPSIALTDPASGGFPACVTGTASHTITIGGPGDCTIQGYDFSLGNGYIISANAGCSSGTVTIKNNKFLIGSNFGPSGIYIIFNTGNCSFVLDSNTIDGNGCNFTNLTALVSQSGTGTFLAQYNEFLNSPQHGISMGQSSGSTNSFISRFNYYRSMAYGAGNHGDPFIFNTSGTITFTTATSTFDVMVQSSVSGDISTVGNCPANSPLGAGAGVSGQQYFAPGVTGTTTMTGVVISNNTIIASKKRGADAAFIGNTSQMNSGVITSPVITNNYLDTQGLASTVWNIPNATGASLSGNLLLTTGASCNTASVTCP